MKVLAIALAGFAAALFASNAQAADLPLPHERPACTVKCTPKVIHAPHRVEMKAPPPKTVVVRQDVYVVTKPRIHYAPPPVVYVQPPPPITYEWPEVVHVPPPPPPRVIHERPCRPCARHHVRIPPCNPCERPHRTFTPCNPCGHGIGRREEGPRMAGLMPGQHMRNVHFHCAPGQRPVVDQRACTPNADGSRHCRIICQ